MGEGCLSVPYICSGEFFLSPQVIIKSFAGGGGGGGPPPAHVESQARDRIVLQLQQFQILIQTRDQTCASAVTWAIAKVTPDP